MWKTKTLKRAQKELDDWSAGNKDYNNGRSGKYPAFEEYLGADKADEKYHNKINRPTVLKNRVISIFVAALIIAPALFGIFHIGSHIFNSITNGNTEVTPQVTTSAPTNTPTETQTPAPAETVTGAATESAQAHPEPYVNKEGHTVYPAVDDNKTVANTASSVLQAVKRFIIKSIPYILVFLLVISILVLLS